MWSPGSPTKAKGREGNQEKKKLTNHLLFDAEWMMAISPHKQIPLAISRCTIQHRLPITQKMFN
jgi:hypothetical protein